MPTKNQKIKAIEQMAASEQFCRKYVKTAHGLSAVGRHRYRIG